MKARKKAKSITCWFLVDADGDVVYDITSDRLFAFLCTTRKKDLPKIYDCVPVKARLVFKKKKKHLDYINCGCNFNYYWVFCFFAKKQCR